MIKILRQRGLLLVALIALVAVAGLSAACSDSEDASTDTTTTTITISVEDSATTKTTGGEDSATTTEILGATTEETLVVGGESKETYEASLPDLEAAVAAAPDDLDKLQKLAVAQYQTGRLSDAASTYRKMLAIEDNAFTRNNLANVLRDMGDMEEAKTLYREALATDPTLVHPYVNLAHILLDEGDGRGALELLQSGLEKVTGDDKTSIQSFIDRLAQ